MSSVRVNLLKPAEARYQGLVSKAFAARAALWGGGALLLLLVGVALVNHRSTVHGLKVARESWASMEPRYERVKAMQEKLARGTALKQELTSWNSSRVAWSDLLEGLGKTVPAEVQLTKLTVRSEFTMLPGADGKKENGLPARTYTFRIDGQTSSEQADSVVVRFVDALREESSGFTDMDSIKLQGLQRARAGDAGEGQRVFGIEGASHPRMM